MCGLTELAGKTALVTGGAKRLGASTARCLAAHGARPVIHYNTSVEEAESLAVEIRNGGGEAFTVQGDLSVSTEADTLWDKAADLAGPIDILMNSASIFPEATLEELTAERLATNVQINAMSPFYLARRFAASGGSGVVVNFLDTMVRDYDRKHVPYHLSKKMLHDLTRMMAVEYAPRIRVNAVAPGLVLPPAGKDAGYLEGLKHSNPLQTYGSGEQVAHAVLFLVCNEFVTGQTIYVDGGRNLRGTMYE